MIAHIVLLTIVILLIGLFLLVRMSGTRRPPQRFKRRAW